MDDRELLLLIRQGDQRAFDAIFRQHYGALVGVAERMLRDRAVAEEIVQDVMLELWRRRETLSVDESLRAYLFQAARNRALNHLRHEQVVRRAEPQVMAEAPVGPSADVQLAEDELAAAIGKALDALPAGAREVFELSRVRGLRYQEIASTLGISVKTVEARMGRALRSLREELRAWLPGGGEL